MIKMSKETAEAHKTPVSENDPKKGQFRLGELFCGPGGLAWGATHAKIRNSDSKIIHEWATDYDENTCKTYIRNICPQKPETVICADIRKIDLKILKKFGGIDVFVF